MRAKNNRRCVCARAPRTSCPARCHGDQSIVPTADDDCVVLIRYHNSFFAAENTELTENFYCLTIDFRGD